MSRKLTLRIDDLEVTSFSANGDSPGAQGTVKGNAYTVDPCYDSQDTFCPSNVRYSECCGHTPTAQTCRASCPNYTCEGITCGVLIC